MAGLSGQQPFPGRLEHEYVVVYAKNHKKVPKVWTTPTDETRDALLEHYGKLKRSTKDFADLKRQWARFVKANKESVDRLGRYTELDPERGPYQVAYRVHNPKKGGYRYGVWQGGVVKENDRRSYAMPLNGYRFKPETMERLIEEGTIVFPKSRDQIVQMKDFLTDYRGTLRSVIDLDARSGAYRLKQLFGDDFEGFKNPKPVDLIEMLVGAAGDKDSIVFDPFAGSGTTADAVLQLNRVDKGRRRFILIEDGNGPDDYAKTLTAPRVRRVMEVDDIASGFTFMRTGRELDREAILGLEREKIVAVICQTDRTGAGAGIRRITGKQWVIGANQRGEAIALVWNGITNSRVTTKIINDALAEAKRLRLKTPLAHADGFELGPSIRLAYGEMPDASLGDTPPHDFFVHERFRRYGCLAQSVRVTVSATGWPLRIRYAASSVGADRPECRATTMWAMSRLAANSRSSRDGSVPPPGCEWYTARNSSPASRSAVSALYCSYGSARKRSGRARFASENASVTVPGR